MDFVSASASPVIECTDVLQCPPGYTACTIPGGQVTGTCTGINPWTFMILQEVNEAAGWVFIAVSVPPDGSGGKGTNKPGVMASLKFNKVGTCNCCDVCFDDVNPRHTRLTTSKGDLINVLDPHCCTGEVCDDADASINCPGDREVNVECDSATAGASWPAVSAGDTCGNNFPVDCSCIHEPPTKCSLTGELCNRLEEALNQCGPGGLGVCVPRFAAVDCDGYASSGAADMPQGRYSFHCEADDTICDESLSCDWTVTVTDQTTLDIVVQLSPIVEDAEFTRCICFELYTSCFPEVFEEVCWTLTFGGPFQIPGHSEGWVKVPKGGNYICVTARDRQHSLRATHFPLVCDGMKYSAIFKGDPFWGGNWLIQGNLNRDNVVDILDFGTYLGQLNQNPEPGPDKACEDNDGLGFTHGDINGDGVVDVADFTFVQINFLEHDKNSCCPDGASSTGAVAGRTSISVKELREIGLGDLAVADLNNDGFVDTDDMAAYVAGARPKPADKGSRGSVGRTGRLNK
jgi:hypothetical protein